MIFTLSGHWRPEEVLSRSLEGSAEASSPRALGTGTPFSPVQSLNLLRSQLCHVEIGQHAAFQLLNTCRHSQLDILTSNFASFSTNTSPPSLPSPQSPSNPTSPWVPPGSPAGVHLRFPKRYSEHKLASPDCVRESPHGPNKAAGDGAQKVTWTRREAA